MSRNRTPKMGAAASTDTITADQEPLVDHPAIVEMIADEAADLEVQIADAKALLEANGYVVRLASAITVRATVAKADPTEVAAYFAATGLTRKQIAGAVGVSVSVIATVQNPKGDRWSQSRFEAAKVLIDAEAERLTAPAVIAEPEAETVVEEIAVAE